jgi:hypothetical protein
LSGVKAVKERKSSLKKTRPFAVHAMAMERTKLTLEKFAITAMELDSALSPVIHALEVALK